MPAHRKWTTPRVKRSSIPDFIEKSARERDAEGLRAVRDLVQKALDLIGESEAERATKPQLRAILAEIDAELTTTQED